MSTRDHIEKDLGIISPSKPTTLNPNAAEFVPSSLISLAGPTGKPNTSSVSSQETSGKVFDRSGSNASNNSEDEAQQYWHHQLPDDITPDFKAAGENMQQVQRDLSHLGLSSCDRNEASHFAISGVRQLLGNQQAMPLCQDDAINLNENMRYSINRYSGDQSSSAFANLASNAWERQFYRNDPHGLGAREPLSYVGDTDSIFPNKLINDQNHANGMPIKALSQFPAQRPSDFCDVNGCDLNTKFESHGQLKVDDGFGPIVSSKTLSSPNLSTLGFPAFAVPDMQSGLPKSTGKLLQPASNTYTLDDKGFPLVKSSHLGMPVGAINPVSAVQRVPSQDVVHWKYYRSGSAKFSVGSSRDTEYLTSSLTGVGRPTYNAKMRSLSAGHANQWLGAGDASELREDDYGQRNEPFVQIVLSYIRRPTLLMSLSFPIIKVLHRPENSHRTKGLFWIQNFSAIYTGEMFSAGKRALANELMGKGQLYRVQSKASNEICRPSIPGQRSLLPPDIQLHSIIQDPIIDLRGLHTSEAIQHLKCELSNLRRMAKSTQQHFHVSILVGAHAKGSLTPGLPNAIKWYLLEEGLLYSELQSGLLQVAIY